MVQPHEKTMKMQWIEVDGRSVPLVLPQYWDNDLEEWIVTGTDNPLQVDARLTGSNVEDGIPVKNVVTVAGETVFEEIEVASGATLNTPVFKVDFLYYTTYVRATDAGHDFAVTISFMAEGVFSSESTYAETKPLPKVISNRNHTTGLEKWETYTGYMRWNIKNKSESIQNYLVGIWRFNQ